MKSWTKNCMKSSCLLFVFAFTSQNRRGDALYKYGDGHSKLVTQLTSRSLLYVWTRCSQMIEIPGKEGQRYLTTHAFVGIYPPKLCLPVTPNNKKNGTRTSTYCTCTRCCRMKLNYTWRWFVDDFDGPDAFFRFWGGRRKVFVRASFDGRCDRIMSIRLNIYNAMAGRNISISFSCCYMYNTPE